MAKVKILKKPKKNKVKLPKNTINKAVGTPQNKFKDNYFDFYDDIKTPTKKYDW